LKAQEEAAKVKDAEVKLRHAEDVVAETFSALEKLRDKLPPGARNAPPKMMYEYFPRV
jgi:hypothetical protein